MQHTTMPIGTSQQLAAEPTITATRVPNSKRLGFLPKAFGPRLMMRVEHAIYAWMQRLCPDYSGGYWEYYELSNGGAYFVLQEDAFIHITVEGNHFDEEVSPEVAGLIVTAMALNHLLFAGADELIEKFEQLQDFIRQHPSSLLILAALD